MRKFMSVIMIAALLLTSAVPAFGSSADSAALERAIKNVRSVIDIPTEASIFEHHFWDDPASGRVWYLSWRDENFEISYNVTIDDSGTILNFFAHERREPGGLGTISREQGQKVAESFLSKVLPSGMDDVRLRDLNSSEWAFTFVFGGYMNGFPVSDMLFYVSVDKFTEKVSNYSGQNMTDRNDKFPVPGDKISEDEAKEAYIESGSVSLVYNGFYDWSKRELVVFPSFVINTGKFVDAESGKVVDGINVFWPAARGGWGGASMEAATDSYSLTPGERDAVDSVAGLITRQQATRFATSAVPGLSSSSTLLSAHLSLRFDDRDKHDWYLQFENHGVTIDATNGELVSFRFFGERDVRRPGTISRESAEKTARDFINRVASEKFKQTVFDESRSSDRIQPLPVNFDMPYSFTFVRDVDGIKFPYNYITVFVDSSTGTITNYELRWNDNAKFPEISDIISMEEAFDIFADEIGFGLLYTRTAGNTITMSDTRPVTIINTRPVENTMTLVYGFMSFPEFSLDPATGAKLGFDGEPHRDRRVVLSYDDIEGKWYESTVTALLDNGYFIEGSSFNGSAQITQEEFLRYLHSPMQAFFSQDDFYDMLVQSRVITRAEIAPDSILVRQDAAKFAIRFLGLDKAAQDGSIFINLFSDTIPESYRGYAALVRSLGIMQGDSRGNFNGADSMNRAQAAVVIHNLLQNR